MSVQNIKPITGGMVTGLDNAGMGKASAPIDPAKFEVKIGTSQDKVIMNFIDIGQNPKPGMYPLSVKHARTIGEALLKAAQAAEAFTTIKV